MTDKKQTKAYVIKNKDNKYLAIGGSTGYEHYWVDDLRYAFDAWLDKSYADDYVEQRYPDCQVVPITIQEGDDNEAVEALKEVDRYIKEEINGYVVDDIYVKGIVDAYIVARNIIEKTIKEYGGKYE